MYSDCSTDFFILYTSYYLGLQTGTISEQTEIFRQFERNLESTEKEYTSPCDPLKLSICGSFKHPRNVSAEGFELFSCLRP